MSVPETEPPQPAERSPAATASGPKKAGGWSDPRLPWLGKPQAADILCWLGIVLSGVYFWALLPLRVSLVGTHPIIAVVLNGSTESIISAAAFARAGDGTLALVLLAAIPGLIKFDALYWWAGRLWGERFIMTMPGSRRVASTCIACSGRPQVHLASRGRQLLPPHPQGDHLRAGRLGRDEARHVPHPGHDRGLAVGWPARRAGVRARSPRGRRGQGHLPLRLVGHDRDRGADCACLPCAPSAG